MPNEDPAHGTTRTNPQAAAKNYFQNFGCLAIGNPTLNRNFHRTRSALRRLDDAQIDQLAIEGYRPVDWPELLQQGLDESLRLLR